MCTRAPDQDKSRPGIRDSSEHHASLWSREHAASEQVYELAKISASGLKQSEAHFRDALRYQDPWKAWQNATKNIGEVWLRGAASDPRLRLAGIQLLQMIHDTLEFQLSSVLPVATYNLSSHGCFAGVYACPPLYPSLP